MYLSLKFVNESSFSVRTKRPVYCSIKNNRRTNEKRLTNKLTVIWKVKDDITIRGVSIYLATEIAEDVEPKFT